MVWNIYGKSTAKMQRVHMQSSYFIHPLTSFTSLHLREKKPLKGKEYFFKSTITFLLLSQQLTDSSCVGVHCSVLVLDLFSAPSQQLWCHPVLSRGNGFVELSKWIAASSWLPPPQQASTDVADSVQVNSIVLVITITGRPCNKHPPVQLMFWFLKVTGWGISHSLPLHSI